MLTEEVMLLLWRRKEAAELLLNEVAGELLAEMTEKALVGETQLLLAAESLPEEVAVKLCRKE